MREGPDIALIGSLIGDPARANMLVALMSGKALTASELANTSGVTLPTSSSHLSKLESAGLIRHRKQGRHRYYALSGDEVGQVLEAIMGLAARQGHMRTRTGPSDPALRKARVCYNHLAGDMGISMFDSMTARGLITEDGDELTLTVEGETFAAGFGIDVAPLRKLRRPLCRSCLDWSARRTHLAGSLGAAMLDRMTELGWAKRLPGSRVIAFTRSGERAFEEVFGAGG